MKKILIFTAILILIIAMSGYLYVQKQLLPNIIADLEQYLSNNTSYKFKIDRPKIAMLKVIFPKIEIGYQKETFFIYDLNIYPNLTALIDKQGEITGSGILQLDEQQLHFNILDSVYDIKTKELLLSLEIPGEPIEKLLYIASSIGKIKLSDYIKTLEGLCKVNLFMKSTPKENIDLETNLYITNLKLNSQNIELTSPEIHADYMLKDNIPSLTMSVDNIAVLDIKQNKTIIEKGSLTAETDLKTIEITDLKFINNDTAWQGTAKITDLKLHPTLNFNIGSKLFNSVGEIRKISNIFNFRTNIRKNKAMLNINGHYDIETQNLQLTGEGSTNVAAILDYIALPENSNLNKIESNIKIENFNLKYNINNKGLTANTYMVLSDISYNKSIIAQSGSLDLKMKDRDIVIENFYLGDRTSSIQTMGNFTIKDKIPFKLDLYIRNYEIEKLIKPFLSKDIGNGLLFSNSSIKGDLKDLDSIIGICKWEFREGDLGKLKFLSQIASLINKPGLSEISFTQGKGSLSFQKLTLQSPESILISDYVNLLISGAMNTKGALDVTVVTEFPQEEQQEESSSPFGKLGDILSLGVQEFFHKIKITGTTENPKYTLIPASVGRILQNLLSN